MKTLQKTFLFGLLILPVIAFSQTDVSDIKAQIEALKAERTEIKAQVENGELTKEEAKALWQEKVENIRTIKEQVFENRLEKLKEKYAAKAALNPEKAEEINARLTEITESIANRRAEAKAFKADIKAKVESGEITKSEAKDLFKEKHETMKAAHSEKREAKKAERNEKAAARQAEAKEERQAVIEDLKTQVESGELTKEEAKEMFEEKREEQKEKMEERNEKLKELAPKKYEALQERIEERKENKLEGKIEGRAKIKLQ